MSSSTASYPAGLCAVDPIKLFGATYAAVLEPAIDYPWIALKILRQVHGDGARPVVKHNVALLRQNPRIQSKLWARSWISGVRDLSVGTVPFALAQEIKVALVDPSYPEYALAGDFAVNGFLGATLINLSEKARVSNVLGKPRGEMYYKWFRGQHTIGRLFSGAWATGVRDSFAMTATLGSLDTTLAAATGNEWIGTFGAVGFGALVSHPLDAIGTMYQKQTILEKPVSYGGLAREYFATRADAAKLFRGFGWRFCAMLGLNLLYPKLQEQGTSLFR